MWTKIIIVVDEQMHSLFIKIMKKNSQRKPKKKQTDPKLYLDRQLSEHYLQGKEKTYQRKQHILTINIQDNNLYNKQQSIHLFPQILDMDLFTSAQGQATIIFSQQTVEQQQLIMRYFRPRSIRIFIINVSVGVGGGHTATVFPLWWWQCSGMERHQVVQCNSEDTCTFCQRLPIYILMIVIAMYTP